MAGKFRTPDCNAIWRLGVDPLELAKLDTQVIAEHPESGFCNLGDLERYDSNFGKFYGVAGKFDTKQIESIFHLPFRLYYPSRRGFLPDYLDWHGVDLCSLRLREAMLLSEHEAQFLDLDVVAPDPRVHAMDYKILRVLTEQSTIDLDRSNVDFREHRNHATGELHRNIIFIRQLAIKQGFRPQAQLFRAIEDATLIFASDALAERVMRAGCLGIEFEHPENYHWSSKPRIIRTARGIEESGPVARRAHLRRVKRARAGSAVPGRP